MLIPEGDVIYESGVKSVSSASFLTFTFTTGFTTIPSLTVTVKDDNVNVYIDSISTTGATIVFSSAYTGEIHYHAIQRNDSP